MNKSLKYLLIPFVILSFPSLAQLQPARTDGLHVKDYFLKKKKIMSSQYDRKGNLIFEWCNRPDLLSKQDIVPYIRFYEYDGQETKITTYMAQLKNDKKVIFNEFQRVNIFVSRMIGGEFESSYEGFLQDPAATYLINEVPGAKVEFRKRNTLNNFTLEAAVDSTRPKPVMSDSTIQNELVSKINTPGAISTVQVSKLKLKVKEIPHPIQDKMVYDEQGRLVKREEFMRTDFTFSETPVFKVKREYIYIYNDPKSEQIFIRDKQKLRTFKIRISNQYY